MQQDARPLELESEAHLDQPQACQCGTHRFLPIFAAVEHEKPAAAGAGDLAAAGASSDCCSIRFIDRTIESSAKSRNFTNPMPGVEAAGGPGIAMAAPESP